MTNPDPKPHGHDHGHDHAHTSHPHDHGDQGHVHGPECAHDHSHAPLAPFVNKQAKVGRNDPCPCGSGAKYKKCCASKA